MNAKSITGRKALSVSLMASGILVLTPALAFASESESTGGVSLLIPKLGEFIPAVIAFLILWFVLAKFGWPVIVGMLDKRAATIKDSLEKAEEARIEGERLLDEYKAQMAEARKESATIVAEAKQSGEVLKADITAKAHAEAADMITKATLAIEAEKKAAIAELQASVADISVSVAGRLIGENLSDDQHRKLIERYVAEAGSLDAN